MERAMIRKQEWQKLLALEVEEGKKVFAPQSADDGVYLLPFSEGGALAYDYINCRLSAKDVFFPRREALLRYGGEEVRELPPPEDDLILFGLRPCDARALLCLDMVFSGEGQKFIDPYYSKRRSQALIVTLACREPGAGCFCTDLGSGPQDREGSDLLVTEAGDKLSFSACSGKGSDFLRRRGTRFAQDGGRGAETEQPGTIAAVSPPPSGFKPRAVYERLKDGFEDPHWAQSAGSCLGCGACTYLCPTCHCFDLTDEEDGPGSGARVRSWDSCQYPLFTRHASGHNPRPGKKARLRQRIMHKFFYAPDAYGAVFCVGCGRCLRRCPVNRDIRELLSELSDPGA
jgi:sulfhydrogenase subunit beta (sulfur reductase)